MGVDTIEGREKGSGWKAERKGREGYGSRSMILLCCESIWVGGARYSTTI